MDAAVTEVGREVRQLALGVDPLAIPLEHPVDDKCVAEIVDARPARSRFGLETRGSDHPPQQPLRGHEGITTTAMTEERRVGILRQASHGALCEVTLEHVHDGRLERQAPGLEELALADLERLLLEPKIAELQPTISPIRSPAQYATTSMV